MTSRVTILPAVNRNLLHVFDRNEAGLVAYGSRSAIYILNFRLLPPVVLDNKVLHNSHRGKVLSISFCKVSNTELLASVGEDALLKIWDLTTGTCTTCIEVKEFSKVVEWLYDSTDSVVFPDYNGCVTKWNFKTNKLIRMKSGSEVYAVTLASNPKSSELLAVGHSSGAMSILNVVNHVLLYKLRIHSTEITSLSWSPAMSDILLSTSFDQSARLWKMGEDKPIKTFYFPTTRNKFEDKKNLRVCGFCHPENPDVIICSNVRGDFGSVTFKENEMPKFTSFTSAKDWDNGFKSVITMLPYFDEKENVKRHLLLSSDHLKVSLWDISQQKLVSSFPFLIGGIFDLTLSRLNPNSLSVCTGDGTLKIWNLSSEEKLEMTTIYIHHRVKIMTAAWHPYEENVLAYGTDEGRVAVADTHRKKSMYAFESHHSGCIYSLQWGPCSKIKNTKDLFLYSCGGGVIYIHEVNKPKEKAQEFTALIELPADFENTPNQHSEICWKSDYTCFAVGSYKGFVDLFNCDFSFLSRFVIQMKNIESLRWHPLVTLASPGGSPYKAWLGAAGNDEKIHIIDTSDLNESGSAIMKSTKVLVGHKKRVSSICWSQHTDGLLASASRDGTVQVWNVCTNTLIANYPWHRDMVHAVYWSASDPDVIYSGGTDNSLRTWNISHQTASGPPEKSMLVKYKILRSKQPAKKSPPKEDNNEKKLSESQINTKDVVDETSELVPKEEVPIMNSTKEKFIKYKFSETSMNGAYTKKNASLFSNLYPQSFAKEKYLENIFKLVDHLYERDNEVSSAKTGKLDTAFNSKFGFFTDQNAALEMLATHAKSEEDDGNKLRSVYLNLMACNTKPVIIEAVEKKALNDFLVSASASVSLDFWREICVKYAIQLVEEELFVKASLYYMFGERLYDGIKLLAGKGKVLEALAFAKARLPENDPCVVGALEKAAKHFCVNHQIECEAACRLALKDPLQAAKILYCAADSKYIYAATYICNKFKLKEQAEAYAYFCMEKCLTQNDWQTFYKVIDQVESLKIYTALIKVHELISNHLKPLKKEDGLVATDVFGMSGSKVQIWSGKFNEGAEQSLLAHALKVLLSEGIIQTEDKESLERILEALNSLEAKRKRFEISAEAHICVAIYATQAIVSSVLGNFDQMKKFLNKIFSTSYNVVFLPKIVCWLFLPLNVYYCKDTEVFNCDTKYQDQESSIEHCFQTFYKSLSSKLSNLGMLQSEDCVTYLDVLPHLEVIVQNVVTLLSTKDIGDSIILYFFANYLNEMRRLTKKGWKFRCHENAPSDAVVEVLASNINKAKSFVANSENSVADKSIELFSVIKDTCENIQGSSESCANDTDITVEIQNGIVSDAESQVKPGISNLVEEKLVEMSSKEETGESVQPILEPSTINNTLDELEELIQTVLKEAEAKKQLIIESQQKILEQNGAKIMCFSQTGANSHNGVISENVVSQNVTHEEKAEGNGITQGSEITSLKDNQHIECWNDVSVCYILTKSLFSILCRNEFAVLYFLEKYLQSARITGVTSAAKQSTLLPESVNTEIAMPNGAKDTCIGDHEQTKSEENDAIKEKLLKSSVGNPSIDSNSLDVSAELSANLNSSTTNESRLSDIKDSGDVIANYNEKKLNVNGDILNEVTLETEVEEITGETVLSLPCNGSVNEAVIISRKDLKNLESTYINTLNVEKEKIATSDALQHERESISEQFELLKSMEFQYPNPFDAASNITAICCDIFSKNPCKVVQDKFHTIAHQVIEWRQNFSVGNVPIICEICQKTTCA